MVDLLPSVRPERHRGGGPLRSNFLAPVAAALLASPLATVAAPFPTRGAETGLLHVPSAEIAPRGTGSLSLDLRLRRGDVMPTPAALVAGLTQELELGVSLREGGAPGDPEPTRLLLGAAAKLRLAAPDGLVPGLALDATLDRVNWDAVASARLVASTDAKRRVRLAASAGAEAPPGDLLAPGLTTGLAAAVALAGRLELVGAWTRGPRGSILGGALRWSALDRGAFQVSLSHIPGERGVQVAVGLVVTTAAPQGAGAARTAEELEEAPAAPGAKPSRPVFLDERTHGRLAIPRTHTPPVPARDRPDTGAGDGGPAAAPDGSAR